MPAKESSPPLRGRIHPRHDASVEQLHILFGLLSDWTEREIVTGQGPLLWLDNAAVWNIELGLEPTPIDFALTGDMQQDRAQVFRYLREILSDDLVADVQVDGQSWTS